MISFFGISLILSLIFIGVSVPKIRKTLITSTDYFLSFTRTKKGVIINNDINNIQEYLEHEKSREISTNQKIRKSSDRQNFSPFTQRKKKNGTNRVKDPPKKKKRNSKRIIEESTDTKIDGKNKINKLLKNKNKGNASHKKSQSNNCFIINRSQKSDDFGFLSGVKNINIKEIHINLDKKNNNRNQRRIKKDKTKKKNTILLKKKNKHENQEEKNENQRKNFEFDELRTKIMADNNTKKLEYDMRDFLFTNKDEMDYDDAIKKDNRPFCEFFMDRIKDKQMLINICCSKDVLKPVSIKLLLLIINFDLYFIINGLFFNEEYISEVYNSTEKEEFYTFLKREGTQIRFVKCTLVGTLISIIISLFISEPSKIKRIFKRERNNAMTLKYEMSLLIKKVINTYKVFIFLCFLILIFSWYYVSCFNNVYYYSKYEWIYSSIAITFIMQILPIIFCFIEAIIRAISFKCKSERVYKLKSWIAGFFN